MINEVKQEEPEIVMDPILANLHEDWFSHPRPTKFGQKQDYSEHS